MCMVRHHGCPEKDCRRMRAYRRETTQGRVELIAIGWFFTGCGKFVPNPAEPTAPMLVAS